MRSPIETKVAAGGITGYAITLILQLLQTYVHGFHSPPAATVAAAVTTLTAVVAYYAPHTPRPSDAPAAAPAAVRLGPAFGPAGTSGLLPEPAVQPAAVTAAGPVSSDPRERGQAS